MSIALGIISALLFLSLAVNVAQLRVGIILSAKLQRRGLAIRDIMKMLRTLVDLIKTKIGEDDEMRMMSASLDILRDKVESKIENGEPL